ncbi:MAG: hypothetical protein QW514_02645 [Thermoprotei archaeon]
MAKRSYDFRGRLSNLGRSWRFDREAFIHALFYRILIPYTIVYGVILLVGVFVGSVHFLLRPLTLVEWVLFTPQVYETAKAFSLIATRGQAFGHLNESYLFLVKKRYGSKSGVYRGLPYVVIALWIVGFILAAIWWSI